MTSFDDREKAFEDKYAHDEALRFKVAARRNRLLGQWAAETLGKAGDDAEAYVKAVMLSDFEAPGDDDVLQKVLGDFIAAGVQTDAPHIRKKMDELLAQARLLVMAE